MQTKRDLQRLLKKFKTNHYKIIQVRYINDDLNDIKQLVNHLDDTNIEITINSEEMSLIKDYFDCFLLEYDEDIENFINKNIDEVSLQLLKFFLQILNEIIVNKETGVNSEDVILQERLRLIRIKEKAYLTEKDVLEIYDLKKDMLLTLRNRKDLLNFQIEENGKVLYEHAELKAFMKKYTR